MTSRTFLIRSFTWMVWALYIMCPTFDGSGQDWIFSFHTCYFGWKAIMFSWRILLKVLKSSDVLLNSKWALTLRFFAAGGPSSSHFLKLNLYMSAPPLFQESLGCFHGVSSDIILFVGNGIVGAPSTPSWYGIHTVSYEFPRLFFDDGGILLTVYMII